MAKKIKVVNSDVRTLKDRLDQEFKNPEFKKLFDEEKRALEISMKIIELRHKLGLSQIKLARLMGTSQQTVSRL